MSKRGTSEEIERRRNQIHVLLDKGYEANEIVRVMTQTHKISERSVFRDLASVYRDRKTPATPEDFEKEDVDMLSKMKHIYRVCMSGERPDLNCALKSLLSRARVLAEMETKNRKGSDDGLARQHEHIFNAGLQKLFEDLP